MEVTLQFIPETGKNRGLRDYDRSLHARQCIRRVKSKRTRASRGKAARRRKTSEPHESSLDRPDQPDALFDEEIAPLRRPQSLPSGVLLTSSLPYHPKSPESWTAVDQEIFDPDSEDLIFPDDETAIVLARPPPKSINRPLSPDPFSIFPVACDDYEHTLITHREAPRCRSTRCVDAYPKQI